MATIIAVFVLILGAISTLSAFFGKTTDENKPGWNRVTRVGWVSLSCLSLLLVLGIAKELIVSHSTERKDQKAESDKEAEARQHDQELAETRADRDVQKRKAEDLAKQQTDTEEKLQDARKALGTVSNDLDLTSETLNLQSQATVLSIFANQNVKIKAIATVFILKESAQEPAVDADVFLPNFTSSECSQYAQADVSLSLTDSHEENALYRRGNGLPLRPDQTFLGTKYASRGDIHKFNPLTYGALSGASRGFGKLSRNGNSYSIFFDIKSLKLPASTFYTVLLATNDVMLEPIKGTFGCLTISAEWAKAFKDEGDLDEAAEKLYSDEFPKIKLSDSGLVYLENENLFKVKAAQKSAGSFPSGCLTSVESYWASEFESAILLAFLDDSQDEVLVFPLKPTAVKKINDVATLSFVLNGSPVVRATGGITEKEITDLKKGKYSAP